MPLRHALMIACTATCLLTGATTLAEEPASSAAQPSTVIPPRFQPNPSATLKQQLTEVVLPGDEVLQLDSPAGGVVGFLHRAEQPEALGSILLLPDQQTHPDWPEHTRTLRRGLAEHGWDTLAIYLPPAPTPATPARSLPTLTELASGAASVATSTVAASTAAASNTENNSDSSADFDRYLAQTRQSIAAALVHLQQQNDKRVVLLGIGQGAPLAIDSVLQLQDSNDLRLVMLDTEPFAHPSAPALLAQLAKVKITTLDLYHRTRQLTPQANATAQQRAILARREGMNFYHQRELAPFISAEASDTRLLKHLRGAIKRWIINAEPVPKPTPATPAKKPQTPPGIMNDVRS
ncbi:DUF3530 family protein [Pontibacter sp. JAM-7]|uniref:DUF3530 family protein n=1 Tax=Pontibacter sp. JAM-7 TaxID=3366581 RepID=UPI003AF97654